MLESMTGFGRGTASRDGLMATAEIRSVNNRYLEYTFRLPETLQNYENEFKKIVQGSIARGKLNVSIQIEQAGENLPDITVDPEMTRGYVHLLEQLRNHAGISEPVRLDHLLQFKEVFTTRELNSDMEEQRVQIARKAMEQAVHELKKMRVNEGEELKKDMQTRIDQIAESCRQVNRMADQRIQDARKRLNERVNTLLDKERIDEQRLEQEIVLLAEKLDISEELVRMDSHIQYFREFMQSDTSTGRKLNFLLQEMHREINTMGSKANSSDISYHVVNMKEIIENIREQIQNIA